MYPLFPAMRRNPAARFGDRLVCVFLRGVVLLVLSTVVLGVWLAARGADTLRDAATLLVLGSLMGFFAQVFADCAGAYSRFVVLNRLVYSYAQLWLPAVAIFIVSRLVLGEFEEAGASALAGAFFLLVALGARSQRLKREVPAVEAVA